MGGGPPTANATALESADFVNIKNVVDSLFGDPPGTRTVVAF